MQATRELRSTGINVSRTASGVNAALANEFFALSCAISAAARARGVEKRGPRSEACHGGVVFVMMVEVVCRLTSFRLLKRLSA